MNIGRAIRTLAILAALSLPAAIGAPAATADIPTPTLKTATVKGSTLTYVFQLGSNEDVGGIFLTVRERDNPDNVIVDGQNIDIKPLPPAFHDITETIGVPKETPVCVSFSVWTYVHIGINDDPAPSNQICTDPAVTAKQADLALQNIRGKQDPLAPETYAYLILLDNNSANEATDVTVDLATSGVATFAGDQGLVAPGWASLGFNCAQRPPVGGESSAIACTGGKLKAKDHTDPAVLVTFNSAGFGTIHAQVSGGGDTTPGNNGTALTLQPVQKVG